MAAISSSVASTPNDRFRFTPLIVSRVFASYPLGFTRENDETESVRQSGGDLAQEIDGRNDAGRFISVEAGRNQHLRPIVRSGPATPGLDTKQRVLVASIPELGDCRNGETLSPMSMSIFT